MKIFYGVIVSLISSIILGCTTQKSVGDLTTASGEQKIISSNFPDDWMGYWVGDLKIYKENQLDRTLPMALDHAYTDTVGHYHWAIIYGPDSISGRRDYFLNTIDAEKGHYQVDERNSIILDSYLFDNRMMSSFEVGNSNIQTTYTLEGDKLIFEISAFQTNPIAITGDQVIKGDSIPEVKSYHITTFHRAVLSKLR